MDNSGIKVQNAWPISFYYFCRERKCCLGSKCGCGEYLIGVGEDIGRDADREEEKHSSKDTRWELTVANYGQHMEKYGVDEHQGGEGQTDFGQTPADHGTADAADDDRRIGDIE